jgi:hypothetical protein
MTHQNRCQDLFDIISLFLFMIITMFIIVSGDSSLPFVANCRSHQFNNSDVQANSLICENYSH